MSIREEASQFKLVVKRSSPQTIIIVCITVVIALAAVLVLHSLALNAQSQAEAWKAQAQQLEQENQALEEKIDDLGTLDSIKDVAEDELGMVDPDTIIITPGN